MMFILPSFKLRGKGLAFFLSIAIAFPDAQAIAGDEGSEPERVGRESGRPDFTVLAEMAPNQAVERYYGILSKYDYGIPSERSPESVAEARVWLARNPRLLAHYKELFENTPQWVENWDERSSWIRLLSQLPAEWALRLLGDILLDKGEQTSLKYDTPEKLMMFIEASGGGGGPNSGFTRNELLRMKIAGIPDAKSSKEGTEVLRVWWKANEHRADEIARETWGERAVLNRDLFGATDGAEPESREKPHSGAGDGVEGTKAAERGTRGWIWGVVVGLLVAGAVLLGLRLRKRG